MVSMQDLLTATPEDIAARIVAEHDETVVFVTPILRAREIKLAAAARQEGWKVILIYSGDTPFEAAPHFDITIRATSPREMHAIATSLQPRLCHVFSGAVDETIELFCEDKPSAVVADMNDVFVPSLFNYCEERFEPTRFVLKNADAFCARDLQAKFAEQLDGYELPDHLILFPEYGSSDSLAPQTPSPERLDDEVNVVSVGSFCLETKGMYDSAYLKMAEMLTDQHIHFHIYPHWSYRDTLVSAFKMNLRRDFADFFDLAQKTPYLHIHKSASLDELALELPKYDFGIVSGGSEKLGQRLELLTQNYMDSCYSGRIADYVDARLPVLINEEVGFNNKLLRHYGIGYDLGELHKPGFRDMLVRAKRDSRLPEKMNHTARAMSLQTNAPRLSRFYRQVSASHVPSMLRLSPFLRTLKRLPFVNRPLDRFETKIRLQNKALRELATLNQNVGKICAKQSSILGKTVEKSQRVATSLEQIKQATTDLQDILEGASNGREIDAEQLKLGLARIKANADKATAQSDEDIANARDINDITRDKRRADSAAASLHLAPRSTLVRADEVAGMLNWPEVIDQVEMRGSFTSLISMLQMFENRRSPFNQQSEAWQLLAAKNLDQLLRDGFSNFKRTIAANYFNFFVQNGDPQIAAVEALLTKEERELCKEQAGSKEPDPKFGLEDQFTYWYFVAALWQYLRKTDQHGITTRVSEPDIGGPLALNIDGVLVTQDLANSLLEYRSMSEGVQFEQTRRVLEIGAGHGRNAHAVMSLNPNVQYIIVDIPPTLYVSQRYLSSVFRDRTIFPVTDFSDFDAVRDRIEGASIVFLMPHQLLKLPDNYVQHALSISSFGEMTRSQVQRYFDEIDRVTKGTFYFKQWKKSINPFDNLDFNQDEYPVNSRWRELFRRTCAVQTEFFEALYSIR